MFFKVRASFHGKILICASFQITFSHSSLCVALILVLHISSKLSMHSFCNLFIFFCSSLIFLNSLESAVSSCVIFLLVLTASSNGFIFFTLHTIFTSIFSRNIQPCNITSWVEFFIHCHKFLGLSVHFLQFILIPLKYSSTIPQNGDCPSVQCYYLIPSIQFTPKILIPKLIFHFLFFYSVILQYPQVFRSTFLYLSPIFSPLVNSVPSVDLTFPPFMIITPHFLIPNYNTELILQ